jgi:hypothetical protein
MPNFWHAEDLPHLPVQAGDEKANIWRNLLIW